MEHEHGPKENLILPARVRGLKPFFVMEIMERAKELEAQGRHIIHLEIGEPDFDTPECIKEACARGLRDGHTRYTHSLGLLELREALCEQYESRYGVRVTPDRIIITSGTSPALLLAFSVLLSPGDRVVLTDPHYACYPNFVRYLGAEPLFIDVDERTEFHYDLEALRSAMRFRPKAIVVNSPSNPTGTIVSPEVLAGMSGLGAHLVSDEIYHGLVYDGRREHTALEFTEDAFVLNGFSKLYAMTGWRLGYLIAPRRFVRTLQILQQNFFICPNAFVQFAALAALRHAEHEIEAMKATYNARRVVLLEGLRRLGFHIPVEPTGAFYILAGAQRFGTNSLRLAYDILEGAGVGCTPGIDFGRNAEGSVRFTYANSIEYIEEAIARMRAYLEKRCEDTQCQA